MQGRVEAIIADRCNTVNGALRASGANYFTPGRRCTTAARLQRSTARESAGRGERIRTSGLYVPNVALYQAKLHPDGASPASMPAHKDSIVTTSVRPNERTILAEPLVARTGSSVPQASLGLVALPPVPRLAWPPARRFGGRWPTISRRRSISPLLDGVAHQRALGFAAALHGHQQRQGRLALAQVVADVLAELRRIAFVVEQVVDQLERRAERAAVVGAGLLDGRRSRRRARRPGARWPRTAWRS